MGDRASGREIAAGISGLQNDAASARERRGQAAPDAVAVVAAGSSAELHAEEVFVSAARAEEERFGSLDRPDVEVERAVAVGVERDDRAAIGFQVEPFEEGPLLERRVAGPAVPIAGPVPEPAIPFDAGDAGVLEVERLRPGHVVVPVSERLPPELELAVVVAAVPPHAVGRVDVRPGVVVEI